MTTPFVYPNVPHVRRHGPGGYADHESYRPWIRDEFAFRCVYCLIREMWEATPGVFALDHFLPVAARPDLALEYDNLLYGCIACNLIKGNLETPDPSSCLLHSAVTVLYDGDIRANTDQARKLIDLLGLNRPRLREYREIWIGIVRLAALHDPALFRRPMGYPANLPDLSVLRPPQGNTRPDGISHSHLARRQRGDLPDSY